MKKTNKLISILLALAMVLSLVPINLSVSATPDTDYVASVTDKDGNLIGNYKTFEEAATSAKANPNSTIKLLDNADGGYVRVSSPFTLDLNSYALDMGSQNFDLGSVLEGYDCHLTVTDTSETKTGKITSASYSGVFFVGYSESPGKLTVLNGIVEHNNEFGCTIKLENKGVAEIKGGTFKNTIGAEFCINNWRDNFDGSVDISGGIFPDGFEMNVYSSEYTSTENYLTDLLADGWYFYDADGKKITVADDATKIDGYVQVKEYFAASVTDENGNLIGNYKTFEKSLDAAMVNENSTLTLLDDVIVTELCEITSGTFTIDLNGKTLSGEDTYINILSPVVLTITDSDENGTIEINYDAGSCIYNNGKLTVEKVTIKGARGIDNRGICTLNGITIEVNDREALSNNGTVYIYNSVLKSEKENAIINNPDATLYVYNSKLTGEIGITNHDTAYVYNCEIKGTSYVALNLLSGTIEVTGSSLSGTDLPYGNYSGTPYGEWTVCRYDGVTLIFKDSEFPNGFVVNNISAHTFLAEGYHFRDADGNIINLTEGQRIIDGYVKVTKGADLEKEAVITLDRTEFVYNGEEIKPTVTITVGGKTLIEGKDYTISFSNNTNAGTATVTIKAIGQTAGGIAGGIVGEGNVNIGNSSNDDAIDAGNYTGEITKEFTIIPVTVDIIWSETTEFEFDGNPHSVTATYVDVNGEVVNAEVENGTNTKPGKHTATAQITDENYVASEETTSVDYEIRGKVTLSGTVTTFLSETDEITLTLVKADDTDIAYETVVTGNSAEYVFNGLIEGTYTLTVSKNNHVAKTYEVVVGAEDVSQNVKIHLKGDINGDGKVNTMDVARMNAHAKGVSTLEGYDFLCADTNGDGKVNTMDVARINAHAKGLNTLW